MVAVRPPRTRVAALGRGLRLAAVAATAALAVAGCGGEFDSRPLTNPDEGSLVIDELTGGYTSRIALGAGFRAALERSGLTPRATGDARLDEGMLILPITGGEIRVEPRGDRPPAQEGRIDHDGAGLALTGGRAAVTLRDLTIEQPRGRVVAALEVDGSTERGRLPLLRLDRDSTRPLRLGEDTPGAVLEGTRAILTAEGAAALRDALGSGPRAGAPVGTVKTTLNREGAAAGLDR